MACLTCDDEAYPSPAPGNVMMFRLLFFTRGTGDLNQRDIISRGGNPVMRLIMEKGIMHTIYR